MNPALQMKRIIFSSCVVSMVIIILTLCLSTANCQPPCITNNLHGISIKNNVLTFLSKSPLHLGNYFSFYYNARGLAKHLGICFLLDTKSRVPEPIFKYLPQYVCPSDPKEGFSIAKYRAKINESKRIFDEVCTACDQPLHWKFPHECKNLWTTMRTEMQSEMKMAMKAWEKKAHLKPMVPLASDVSVVYVRCREDDSLLAYTSMGPLGFSHFSHLNTSTEVIIVSAFNEGLCAAIQDARIEWFKKLNPKMKVTIQQQLKLKSLANGDPNPANVYLDFRTLVNAPTLYTEVSSFGLAAAMVGTGTVHIPPLYHAQTTFEADKWVWSESPLFNTPVAVQLNMTCTQTVNGVGCKGRHTKEDVQRAVQWFKTH